MPQPERKQKDAPALDPHRIGNAQATLAPYYVEHTEPRALVTLRKGAEHFQLNVNADEADFFANLLRIVACEARALERQSQRKQNTREALNAAFHIETCWRRIVSHVEHCTYCQIKFKGPDNGLAFLPGCDAGHSLKDEWRIALDRRAQLSTHQEKNT